MRRLLPTDRWRRGEWLVLLALVALVVGVLGTWLRQDLPGADDNASVYVLRGYGASSYAGEFDARGLTAGLGGIGHPWLELVLLATIAAVVVLGLALRSGPGRTTYGAVTALVVAIPIALVALVATTLRLLAFLPGIRPDEFLQELPLYQGAEDAPSGAPVLDAAVGWAGWVGLAGLVLLVVGLWVALADDRTRRRRNGDERPAVRRVPSASAA